MRRRRKAKFSDLFDNGIEVYDQYRMSIKGVDGMLYKLWKPLTKDQYLLLDEFWNVEFMEVRNEYAPELKSKAVFLGDKCFPRI